MKRRIVMAGATFFLAAATGHVMQNGDVIGAKLRGAMGSAQPAAEAAPAVAEAATAPTDAVLVASTSAQTIAPAPAATPATVTAAAAPAAPAEVAAVTPGATPALAEAVAVRPKGALPDLPGDKADTLEPGIVLAARMDAVSDTYQRPKTDADQEYSVFGIPCGTARLDLGLGARGTLKATLTAPCHPEERVVFSHTGLSFTLLTDAAGTASVTIPAMETDATVDAGFASGEVLSAARRVPDLDLLRRVALSGVGVLRLTAFENGAADGATEHYSAGQAGTPVAADAATMITLGDATIDDPKVVQVFTASAGATSVAIAAEAEATEQSCGRTVRARVVSMVAGTIEMNDTLSQAMPGCDALGDMVQSPLPGWDGPLTVATSQ